MNRKGLVKKMSTALHTDTLWSIREDLHERFDGVLGAATVNTVLDNAAAEKAGAASFFKKVLIERAATEQLASMAAGETAVGAADVYPLSVSVLGAAA